MTTPTGKLAWGQAANYDAADDRAVIAAVTRGRQGLVRPVIYQVGTGLQLVIRGGWLGVTRCDDATSAVVGSREDVVVTLNPGPGSGSREDVVWCSTSPDEGTWALEVIPRAQSALRVSGIPLIWVTAGANSNLASQMTLTAVDASLERRLFSFNSIPGGRPDYSASSWAQAAGMGPTSGGVVLEPGQWYRVRYDAAFVSKMTGSGGAQTTVEGRMGIGMRNDGQGPADSASGRVGVISWVYLGLPNCFSVDWVFRHPISAAPVVRIFDGRIWSNGVGTIRPGGYTDNGYAQSITVEDIGS